MWFYTRFIQILVNIFFLMRAIFHSIGLSVNLKSIENFSNHFEDCDTSVSNLR